MTEENKFKDESDDRKYFILTPRIVKAYARDPYDLAVWDTIKDVAGELGECYLSTEQLAILSGMSAGKVSDCRKYWIQEGFLKGEIRQDPGYPQPVWHITIPNVWKRNIEWCEAHPRIQDRIDFIQTRKSLHHMKPSPHEERPSPHETKKNQKQEEIKVNERLGILKKLYENNIALVTPIVLDMLRNAAIEFPDQTWYQAAFEIAVGNNARNWKYIHTVLTNWKNKGRDWTPALESEKNKSQKEGASTSKVMNGTLEFLNRHQQKDQPNGDTA